MSDKTILSLEGLCAGYGRGDAISDISLSLSTGEALCVVGQSGCGKSTLLKSVIGVFDKPVISAGDIVFDGCRLSELSQKRRCALTTSGMGFIFQTPGAAFNPIRSYKKQFIETLKSHDKYDAKSFLPSIKDVFSRLGLQDCERILASCPYEMSGGMNQRIALALVILMQQKLLLADELIAMRTDCGIAQMIVTHDFALASYVADRIAVMHCGRIVELAPAKELVSSPLHPYTRMLLEAVPALGGSIPTFSDAPVQSAGKLIEACAGHFVLSEV